jgi:hypothetical protein
MRSHAVIAWFQGTWSPEDNPVLQAAERLIRQCEKRRKKRSPRSGSGTRVASNPDEPENQEISLQHAAEFAESSSENKSITAMEIPIHRRLQSILLFASLFGQTLAPFLLAGRASADELSGPRYFYFGKL